MKQTEIALSITDANYKQWIVDIEKRFRQQQVKAAIHINSDKIEFIGALDVISAKCRWKSGMGRQLLM